MTGFCEVCGRDLSAMATGVCPEHPRKVRPIGPSHQTSISLPPAPLLPRLLGAGVEYMCYSICATVVTALDIATVGFLGLLNVILTGLILFRDFKGGNLNIAKRITEMRVVDARTGQAATNVQAFLRNSYYLVLPLISAFLPFVDLPCLGLFISFMMLDFMMILASPRRRRLGDILAGTQVVRTRI